jgi:uncharacterized membrane protein YdbT with pleckstrin-like domain
MEYTNVWAKVLREDEKVDYEFSIGKKYRMLGLISVGFIGLIMMLVNPTFGIIIISIALFYFGYYLKVANAYAFTDKRVLIHRGWLSTNTISIEYSKITDVSVQEPFLERLITSTGNLAINTAGSGVKEVVLKHITTPYEVRKKLDKVRS